MVADGIRTLPPFAFAARLCRTPATNTRLLNSSFYRLVEALDAQYILSATNADKSALSNYSISRGWWVHCCADTSPFGGPCNCSVTARSFAWRWWYILLSEDNLELWQLSYVFADCVDWVELLSARMHVFYSRRMSLPTSSTELNCCIGKETRHNSFRQISSTVVLCLCGLLRLSWIVV